MARGLEPVLNIVYVFFRASRKNDIRKARSKSVILLKFGPLTSVTIFPIVIWPMLNPGQQPI